MTEGPLLRRRIKEDTKKESSRDTWQKHEPPDDEFVERESPLTVLLHSSLHIKAIYNIFIAILIILLLDTLTHDFVEHGKVNFGFSTVVHGFGDVTRGLQLWIFEFSVALAFYPCLRVYALGASCFRKHSVLSIAWGSAGFLVQLSLHTALVALPVWELAREHLALASSCVVTLEMLRFSMKMYSVSVACGPRCRMESKPLPSFGTYLYFLFAPTLLYRDQYPRTKRIRWSVVAFHLLEVAGIIFYNSFLWERFILPYWSDYGKEAKVEAGRVARGMFACVLPGMLSFLCGFYCLLHAWLNACAEVLMFADRLFYEEWWTMSQFSRYYRTWNRVVHGWLRDHLYLPLAPSLGRALATFVVFFISAVAHELVLALSFGFFYPVLLVQFTGFGVLCIPLTASSGRRFPGLFNLLMWLCFLFGNGILWSLYPMEYFARKNCPASESDSFFIPKSWSCPQVVMKQNWTFHNPFAYST